MDWYSVQKQFPLLQQYSTMLFALTTRILTQSSLVKSESYKIKRYRGQEKKIVLRNKHHKKRTMMAFNHSPE